ncbi:SWI/SNF-related matrix-associated actin-dependent regulator of chromatin subfamily E member 1-like [Anthonomus grandis grandis]|uniref:SWI/SNF-related matrix-associated actin-dependent regulator of chromatin subfamily E member 1-like n=1 Tax=Anthonomus grandis grandis TaxID=2921223 RepID=UPI002165168B|nr:SWI/SNF-related matrix-associated actin-dependent regulator of chromatin subfamily E member 1-like [Anthonomus grandis grandis]
MSEDPNIIIPNTSTMKLKNTLTTDDEANDILQNGILVETNTGVVCMSLSEATCANINLSSEDLHQVAANLVILQNLESDKKPVMSLPTSFRLTCDSDGGFSSECSDSTYTTTGSSANYSSESLISNISIKGKAIDKSSEESDSTRGSLLGSDSCLSPHQMLIKKKNRGGWPKGRKRKPELLNLPPKAPATGYNLYLNEQRSCFKNSRLPFYEITKIIGNRWSSLTLEEKKPYLDRAEEDKKRYREELKEYRHSAAYRAYLNTKRRKRLQNNVMSESDMDATDDFDEEDNEELYCRTCDQWFHNLHNKREHLQAKKHLTSLAGDIYKELTDVKSAPIQPNLASASLGSPETKLAVVKCEAEGAGNTSSVFEAMCKVVNLVKNRENEINTQKNRQQEFIEEHKALCQQLCQLTVREAALKRDLAVKREEEKELESRVYQLWQAPSFCVLSGFKTPDDPQTDY